MKFDPRILFLITAIICLIFILNTVFRTQLYDDTFWIAILGVFIGLGSWYKEKETS